MLDIHKTRTSPYHLSGNGMVEAFNKTLLNMISAYEHDNQKGWDLHLPLLTSAYRSCTHDGSELAIYPSPLQGEFCTLCFLKLHYVRIKMTHVSFL